MAAVVSLGAMAGVARADSPMWVQGEVPGAAVHSQSLTIVQNGVTTTMQVALPVGSVVLPARLNVPPTRMWLAPNPARGGSGLIPTDIRAKVELIPTDAHYKLQMIGR
jgi:hypothetical protein